MDVEKNELLCIVGGKATGCSLWLQTVWSFLQKLKIELSYNPVITLLGIYSPKYENTNSKGYMYPYGYYSIS